MPSQRSLCFETGGQTFFLDFIVKEIIPVWWHVTGLALELWRRRNFCHYVFKKGFKVQSINPYASKATPSPRASQCTRQGLMALSTPPTWLAACRPVTGHQHCLQMVSHKTVSPRDDPGLFLPHSKSLTTRTGVCLRDFKTSQLQVSRFFKNLDLLVPQSPHLQ